MRTSWVGIVAAAVVVLGAGVGTASAQECGTLGNASDFDAFIRGDYAVGNTQVQGRVAVGGNARIATSGGYAVGTRLTPSPARVDLVVGGTLTVGGAGAQAPNGSVTYGTPPLNGAIATPNGTTTQKAPPFSFDTSFTDLAETSQRLSGLAVNGSQSLAYGALTMRSTNATRAVFSISATDLQAAQQVVFNVPATATVVVNVTGAAYSSATYPTSSMSGVDPTRLVWNFQLATRVQVGPSIQWLGTVLAPHAAIQFTNGQLLGQVVGASYSGDGTIIHTPFGGCLPPAPTHDLLAAALCRDPLSDATSFRVTNTAEHAVTVTWTDADSAQGATLRLPARTDTYIDVLDGTTPHRITVASATETVTVTTATRACAGRIRVSKVVTGDGTPPAGPWQVLVVGDNGYRGEANVNAGQTVTFDVPGDYEPGTVGIGTVVGGARYAVSEPDPRGAVATVSQTPVTIFDGSQESVVVGNAYAASGGGGGGGEEGGGGSGGQGGGGEAVDPPLPGPGDEVIQPSQPTLPPGAPQPVPGPGLVSGASGDAADLAVTQRVSPARTSVGQIELSTTVIRNVGTRPANAVVVREIPQADPRHPNRIVELVSVSAGTFQCTGRRPVSCRLGTLQPGARVTVVARGKMLRAGSYKSVVMASSPTPESNLTNNIGMDGVVVGAAVPPLRVTVRSPAVAHAGQRVSYRVAVHAPGKGVDAVRLCHRPSRGLLVSSAPGTRRVNGRICLDISRLAAGTTRAFTVHAVASAQYAGRRALLPAAADSPNRGRAVRGAAVTAIVDEEPSGLG